MKHSKNFFIKGPNSYKKSCWSIFTTKKNNISMVVKCSYNLSNQTEKKYCPETIQDRMTFQQLSFIIGCIGGKHKQVPNGVFKTIKI